MTLQVTGKIIGISRYQPSSDFYVITVETNVPRSSNTAEASFVATADEIRNAGLYAGKQVEVSIT